MEPTAPEFVPRTKFTDYSADGDLFAYLNQESQASYVNKGRFTKLLEDKVDLNRPCEFSSSNESRGGSNQIWETNSTKIQNGLEKSWQPSSSKDSIGELKQVWNALPTFENGGDLEKTWDSCSAKKSQVGLERDLFLETYSTQENLGGLEITKESISTEESQAEELNSTTWFGMDRFRSRMESSVFRDKNLCLLTEDPFVTVYKPPQSRQPWVNPVSSNMDSSLPPCYPWNDFMEPPHDYWCPEGHKCPLLLSS